MYQTFSFQDKESRENYMKLHAPYGLGGIASVSETQVILPHEVILLAVVEYTNKDPARVQTGWVVYSTFTDVCTHYFSIDVVAYEHCLSDYSNLYAPPHSF